MKKYIRCSKSIFGQAKRLSDIGAEVEESTMQIVEHLAKLYLFPESLDAAHWRKEIAEFLNSVSLRKGTNKLPKPEFIFHNTFEINLPYISSYYNAVYEDYLLDGEVVTAESPNIKDFTERVREYYIWLSDNLSKYRRVPKLDIVSKLKELGF